MKDGPPPNIQLLRCFCFFYLISRDSVFALNCLHSALFSCFCVALLVFLQTAIISDFKIKINSKFAASGNRLQVKPSWIHGAICHQYSQCLATLTQTQRPPQRCVCLIHTHPLGWRSSSLRTVWSQYSNTRWSFRLRRNTSIRFTRLACFSCCNEEKQQRLGSQVQGGVLSDSWS